MEYINCPTCHKKIESITNLCPFCATRVQFVLQQAKEKERQQLIQEHIHEINQLKEERAKYQRLRYEEQSKKCPVDTDAAMHSMLPIIVGLILAVCLIPILKWFTLLSMPFFPCFCIAYYDKYLKSQAHTWSSARNAKIQEYDKHINEIDRKLSSYGVNT